MVLNLKRLPKYKNYDFSGYKYIRGEDTFLVSFPRSGNTWVRYILSTLHPAADLTAEIDIHNIIPNIDQGADISRLTIPRIIKSHMPHNRIFKKVIYLVRDGRDAIFSFYKFSKKEFGFAGSFKDFLNSDRCKIVNTAWMDHVESWLDSNCKHQKVIFVKYEDIKANTYKEICRILDFMNWKVKQDNILDAIANSSISNMKNKERNGSFLAHVGSGKVGDWEKNFSTEELALFLNRSSIMLHRLEYLQ
jgi:hypothetical protein